MDEYEKLATQFFDISYKLKKINYQQEINKSFKGEIFTLLYLKKAENCILPSELSDEMKISSARVAAILNNLEDKNLIERTIDKTDRRKIQVQLTNLGKAEANKYSKRALEHIVKMFKLLGKEDSKELIRIISKILDLNLDRQVRGVKE